MAMIIDDLTSVFRNVLNDDEIVLTPETTANDIEGWDSFSHINLMVAVELKFNIKFTQREIYRFSNVGEMTACIEEKLSVK